jgi:putative ABC transport system substrate-binding protein
MRRRAAILLIGGALVSPVQTALAQTPPRIRRLGVFLSLPEDAPGSARIIARIVGRLRELGWVEGRNLRIDYRFGGDARLYPALAAELVSLSPDVILALNLPIVRALRNETRTIPIVFAMVPDPTGIIETVARPGGNITGFTSADAALGGKWLGLLKEMAPATRHVAVLDPETAGGISMVRSLRDAARSFHIDATVFTPKDEAEMAGALTAFAATPGGGLVVTNDPLNTTHYKAIIAAAARDRLPAIYPYARFAAEGGLIAYGFDVDEHYRNAASYVDLILRGARPSDLPVQAPQKHTLAINRGTAAALGIAVPPALLARADEVIE